MTVAMLSAPMLLYDLVYEIPYLTSTHDNENTAVYSSHMRGSAQKECPKHFARAKAVTA